MMTLGFPNGEAFALNRLRFPETRGSSRPGRLKRYEALRERGSGAQAFSKLCRGRAWRNWRDARSSQRRPRLRRRDFSKWGIPPGCFLKSAQGVGFEQVVDGQILRVWKLLDIRQLRWR